MNNSKSTLVFVGGHHTGALVIAKKLMTKNIQIVWVGHRHSMWGDTSDTAEYREVVAAGIPFYELLAGKFYRTFHPVKLIRLPWGFIQALGLLIFFRIKYGRHLKGIFSSGGYLAVPVVFCGWMLGIPSITHEQTAVAGWANRFISLFVQRIALTWPSSSYPPAKSVITGLPVRQEILHLTRRPGRTLLVLGGKQGSHVINQAIFDSLSSLSDYRIIHQLGRNSIYQDYQQALKLKSNLYQPVEYLSAPELSQAYSECSVVICRSGAHTVYELAILGIPCILIPLPHSSHSEQTANARLLVDAGQAILLPQSRLSVNTLVSSVKQSVNLSAGKISLPLDGTERIVQLIKQVLLNEK